MPWTYFGCRDADVDSVNCNADVVDFLAFDVEDCSGAGGYDEAYTARIES